jgi:hypothetical protein
MSFFAISDGEMKNSFSSSAPSLEEDVISFPRVRLLVTFRIHALRL